MIGKDFKPQDGDQAQPVPALPKNPKLTVCIVTQNMADYLPSVLANVEGICDEIVVVDSFSTDGSDKILAAHPKVRLFQRKFNFNFGEQKNYAINQATGDWVFIVDSDEQLGDRLRRKIPAMIRSSRYTHYKFPRYWLVDADPFKYVMSSNHYPDFQLRLFRNLPFFRYEPSKVVHTHFPRAGRGRGKKMRRTHIFHYDFLLKDRSTRESKFRQYSELEPSSTQTSMMYLYEDADHDIKAARESLSLPHLEARVKTREASSP